MVPLMSNSGWIPEVSSTLSLFVSLLAVAFTGLSFRDRRRRDSRDLFLKLHGRLIDPDLQRGRRLLFEQARTTEQVRRLRDQRPEEFDQVNRAVAMYDIAGMYVERGYVDRELFLAEWGKTYGRAWLASAAFLTVRFGAQAQGWSHFRSLGRQAAAIFPAQVDPDQDGEQL